MNIRMLDLPGAQAALPGLCDVLVDCVDGGASVGFMAPYGIEDAYQFWEGVLPAVASSGTALFVAEADGRIAGTVQVGLQQMPNQPHRGDLKKLLVHRDFRGRGVARALMAAAEAEAVLRGKSLLVLDTATGSPAEELYRRLGWTVSGVIPDYALFPDGRYCDTTVYFKKITGKDMSR